MTLLKLNIFNQLSSTWMSILCLTIITIIEILLSEVKNTENSQWTLFNCSLLEIFCLVLLMNNSKPIKLYFHPNNLSTCDFSGDSGPRKKELCYKWDVTPFSAKTGVCHIIIGIHCTTRTNYTYLLTL